MKTMKMFRNLFIIFVLMFVFVTYMSDAFVKSAYTLISKDEILSDTPRIEIIESRATNVNGYIKAKITNNTSEKIDNQYIKLDFYSKYDNNLGTKYLKVNNLNVGDTKEFSMDFKYEGVKKITATLTKEAPPSYEFSYELSNTDKLAFLIGGLIVTYYMPVRFLFNLFPF